jgi:hypothetical protein
MHYKIVNGYSRLRVCWFDMSMVAKKWGIRIVIVRMLGREQGKKDNVQTSRAKMLRNRVSSKT